MGLQHGPGDWEFWRYYGIGHARRPETLAQKRLRFRRILILSLVMGTAALVAAGAVPKAGRGAAPLAALFGLVAFIAYVRLRSLQREHRKQEEAVALAGARGRRPCPNCSTPLNFASRCPACGAQGQCLLGHPMSLVAAVCPECGNPPRS